jgi:hypothetical protein
MVSNKEGYMENYYRIHKSKIQENSLKKIHCECCNKDITNANWNKHIKNQIHILKNEIYNLKNEIFDLQKKL